MALVSDTVFSLLVVACWGLAASTAALAVAWIRARERAIRAEQGIVQPRAAGDTRLEHLEDAVTNIADEVERVSEGQRFVTRLLEERGRSAASVHGARLEVRPAP